MSVYEEFCKLPDLDREWVHPGDIVAWYSTNEKKLTIKESSIETYKPNHFERVISRPDPFEDVAGTVLADKNGKVVAVRAPRQLDAYSWTVHIEYSYAEKHEKVLNAYHREGWKVLFKPNS